MLLAHCCLVMGQESSRTRFVGFCLPGSQGWVRLVYRDHIALRLKRCALEEEVDSVRQRSLLRKQHSVRLSGATGKEV